MAYVSTPLETDPTAIFDEVVDFIQGHFPAWTPADGNLDTILIEALAQNIAENRELETDVRDQIFRWLGANLHNLPPVDATSASVTSTWTMVNDDGYTIPAGTQVAIPASGNDFVGFEVATEVVVPNGSTVTADGEVLLIAVEEGEKGSGLSGTPQLVDALSYVFSIALVGLTSGGVDAELDSVYLDRLVAELQLLTPRPIIPDDFAVLARRVAGVERAAVIDLYDPGLNEKQSMVATGATAGTATLTFEGQTTANVNWNDSAAAIQTKLDPLSNIAPGDVAVSGGPLPSTAVVVEFTGALAKADRTQMTVVDSMTGGDLTVTTTQGGVVPSEDNERMVTVVPIDEDGQPVSQPVKDEVDELLQGYREVNFVVHVIDPTTNVIDVTAVVVARSGFETDTVEAAAVAALEAYLSPANWGQPQFGDQREWENQTILRYLEVAEVLQRVDGLDYISTLTVEGGTANVNLTGAAPLPEPGTIDITVS